MMAAEKCIRNILTVSFHSPVQKNSTSGVITSEVFHPGDKGKQETSAKLTAMMFAALDTKDYRSLPTLIPDKGDAQSPHCGICYLRLELSTVVRQLLCPTFQD